MLTKTDFAQIKKIVHEEVQTETRKVVREELKPIKEDVAKIRKDIKTIVAFFDREYLELRHRVERIENHLNLPALSA